MRVSIAQSALRRPLLSHRRRAPAPACSSPSRYSFAASRRSSSTRSRVCLRSLSASTGSIISSIFDAILARLASCRGRSLSAAASLSFEDLASSLAAFTSAASSASSVSFSACARPRASTSRAYSSPIRSAASSPALASRSSLTAYQSPPTSGDEPFREVRPDPSSTASSMSYSSSIWLDIFHFDHVVWRHEFQFAHR